MSARRAQRGFTLLEVMLALAFLSFGLVGLLVFTASNVSHTLHVGAQDVAVGLARGKLYDLEEELVTEGFQELDQTKEGDFREEGRPQYRWAAKIEKIELPDVGALQAATAETAGAAATPSAGAPSINPVTGLLAPAAGAGTTAGEGGSTFGEAMLGGQFELIRNLLEEAIRKITLTVSWNEGTVRDEFVVSYYVTDPSAVGRLVPGAGAGEVEAEPSSEGTDGTGTRTATPPGGTGRGGSGGGGVPRVPGQRGP